MLVVLLAVLTLRQLNHLQLSGNARRISSDLNVNSKPQTHHTQLQFLSAWVFL